MGYNKIEYSQIWRDDKKEKGDIDTDKIAKNYAEGIRNNFKQWILKEHKEKGEDANEHIHHINPDELTYGDLIMFDKYQKGTLTPQEFEKYRDDAFIVLRKAKENLYIAEILEKGHSAEKNKGGVYVNIDKIGLENSRTNFLGLMNGPMTDLILKESRLQRNFKKEIKKYQPKQPQLNP